MKKIMSVVLAVCTCVVFCVPAFAAESVLGDVISIEEYEAAIQAEGAKYDIECDVLSYAPNIKITKEMLDYAVNEVTLYAESIEKNAEQKESAISVAESTNPRIMPVTRDVSKSFSITVPHGSAEMSADANVTVDAQGGTVMSINSTDVYQSGLFVNFDSWETTSLSASRNSPSAGWITLNIKGKARFSYADPVTGITTGYTHTENRAVPIECE